MRALIVGGIVGVAAGWAARQPSLMSWPPAARHLFAPTLAVGVGLASAATAEIGWRAASVITGRRPIRSLRAPLVAAASASAVVWLARANRKRALGRSFARTRALGPGFRHPPTSDLVSGGPGSAVEWSRVGREGARFLGVVTDAEDVRKVMGVDSVAEPIRIFVGYDSAPTIAERVHLAISELRRTGAFDRGTLLVQATAGTGFANPTPVNTVEILTRGDCATVAVSYGLLPSFMSLDRVEHGRQTQQQLLEAIAREAPRARVLLYGESLGARVQQAAVVGGARDLHRLGVQRALWVGTPRGAAASWPGAVLLDSPRDIPARTSATVWLLEHDADPVVLMNRSLLWRRPPWLHTARGRGVPEGMRWLPLVTAAQVMMDVVFATDIEPGEFRSSGHDYRADLGAVVTAAFELPSDPRIAERLEARLRQLERARAARIDGESPSAP